MKKFLGMMLLIVIMTLALVGVAGMTINNHVVNSQKDNILVAITDTKDDFLQVEYQAMKDIGADCIVVLGAGLTDEETPSPMLKDRLDTGILLYENGVAPKIIMSGDHGRVEYDEVNVMKKYAIEKGVPSEDIFMDHAGFSTYDSVVRAKEIFDANSIILVTQEYHLYRALYIANQFDINAYGVNADPRKYAGQLYREFREILARNKDVLNCIIKPEPTFLGESIPVSGNGDITNDILELQLQCFSHQKFLLLYTYFHK